MRQLLYRFWLRHHGTLLGFALRLAISLFVLGGIYLLLFGSPFAAKGPTTPIGKFGAIRSSATSLDLANQTLAQYTSSDATSYDSLLSTQAAAVEQTTALQTALKNAPKALTEQERNQIHDILNDAKTANNSFTSVFEVLDKVMQYDPANDLSPAISDPQFALRATAASEGLQNILKTKVTSGSLGVHAGDDDVISIATRNTITASASCFQKLATQATAKQSAEASKTKQQCIKDYPAARKAALSDIKRASYSTKYAQRSQQKTDSLIKALDKTSPEPGQDDTK